MSIIAIIVFLRAHREGEKLRPRAGLQKRLQIYDSIYVQRSAARHHAQGTRALKRSRVDCAGEKDRRFEEIKIRLHPSISTLLSQLFSAQPSITLTLS